MKIHILLGFIYQFGPLASTALTRRVGKHDFISLDYCIAVATNLNVEQFKLLSTRYKNALSSVFSHQLKKRVPIARAAGVTTPLPDFKSSTMLQAVYYSIQVESREYLISPRTDKIYNDWPTNSLENSLEILGLRTGGHSNNTLGLMMRISTCVICFSFLASVSNTQTCIITDFVQHNGRV